MKKKILIILFLLILFILIAIPTFLYLDFKNSPKYTLYQLYVATQNNNAELGMKYFNVEKIVDNFIAVNVAKDFEEDNPYAAFGAAIAQAIKPAMVEKIRKDLETSFNSPQENTVKENQFKLMWIAFRNIPISDDIKSQTYKQIEKNKYTLTQCFKSSDKCNSETFEKIDGKWIITAMDLN